MTNSIEQLLAENKEKLERARDELKELQTQFEKALSETTQRQESERAEKALNLANGKAALDASLRMQVPTPSGIVRQNGSKTSEEFQSLLNSATRDVMAGEAKELEQVAADRGQDISKAKEAVAALEVRQRELEQAQRVAHMEQSLAAYGARRGHTSAPVKSAAPEIQQAVSPAVEVEAAEVATPWNPPQIHQAEIAHERRTPFPRPPAAPTQAELVAQQDHELSK